MSYLDYGLKVVRLKKIEYSIYNTLFYIVIIYKRFAIDPLINYCSIEIKHWNLANNTRNKLIKHWTRTILFILIKTKLTGNLLHNYPKGLYFGRHNK